MSEIITNREAFMKQHAAIWGAHHWPADAVLAVASSSDRYRVHGSVRVADAEGAWKLIEREAKKGHTTYITLNPRASAPAPGTMGKRESVELIAALFVDIDICDEGSEHSVGDQNPTRAEAEEWIRRGPTPTVVNFTGGGFHLFYALEEPLDAKSDEAVDLLAQHRGYWTAKAAAAGKSIDVGPLDNLALAPRPSGTWNAKQGKAVELISAQDWQWPLFKLHQFLPAVDGSSSRRYSPATRNAPVGAGATRTLDPSASIGDRFAVEVTVGEFAYQVFDTDTKSSGAVTFPREDGSLARDANAQLYDDGEAGEQRLTIYGARVLKVFGLESQNNSLTSWDLLGRGLGGDFKLAARLLAQTEVDGTWGAEVFEAARNILTPEIAAAFGIDQDPDYVGPARPVTTPILQPVIVDPAPAEMTEAFDDTATVDFAVAGDEEHTWLSGLLARKDEVDAVEAAAGGASNVPAVPTIPVVDALINRIPIRHDIDNTKSVFLHGFEGRHGIYRRVRDQDTRQESFIRLTDWVLLKSKNTESRTVGDDGAALASTDVRVTVAFAGSDGYIKVMPGFTLEQAHTVKTVIDMLNVDVMIPERDADTRSVANVIRVLGASGGGAEKTSEYGSLGWMKTERGWVYLAPAGSITAKGSTQEFSVGAPPKSDEGALNDVQSSYGWPQTPSSNAEILEAAESILEYLKVTPTKPAAYACLGLVFAAPLALERRTTVALLGLPDNGKSLVAGGAQGFLTGIPTSSGWTGGPIAESSVVASSIVAGWARHGVSVWDDFRVPTKNPQKAATMHSVLSTVMQAAYGNASVGPKGKQEGGLRGTRSSNCAAIITGEALAEEQGVVSRSVTIRLDTGDVAMTPMYNSQFDVFADKYTKKAHLLYAAYLQFLARRLDQHGTIAAFRAANNRARAKVATADGRSAEGVSFLSVGWAIFSEFAEEVGIPQELYPDPAARAAIAVELSGKNEDLVNNTNPSLRIINAARDMLAGGAGHLVGHDGREPHRTDAGVLGWRIINDGINRQMLREVGMKLGVLSEDRQWVVLAVNAVTEIARRVGLDSMPKDQLNGGFATLVMDSTTPGGKSPRALTGEARTRGYTLPASMFDLDFTKPTTPTKPVIPTTPAVEPVAVAAMAPVTSGIPRVDNEWGLDDF